MHQKTYPEYRTLLLFSILVFFKEDVMHSHLYFEGRKDGKLFFPSPNADEAPLWTTKIITTEG